MLELCRSPITSDSLALVGELSPHECAGLPGTAGLLRSLLASSPLSSAFFPDCGLQAFPDFFRLTARCSARPFIGLGRRDLAFDPSHPTSDLRPCAASGRCGNQSPSPLTSDSARRVDVVEITESLDPNTLHGEQTPASACSDAVRSDLTAAGAKMAAFRR